MNTLPREEVEVPSRTSGNLRIVAERLGQELRQRRDLPEALSERDVYTATLESMANRRRRLSYDMLKKVLSDLDQVARMLGHGLDGHPASPDEQSSVTAAFPLNEETLRSTVLGFSLGLILTRPAVDGSGYPHLFAFAKLVAAGDGFVANENHNFGYHIHYYDRKERRTNVIFTFDPQEPRGSRETTFWEGHAGGSVQAKAKPDKFGDRRKMAIHDSCVSFLRTVSKGDFKTPSTPRSVLWCG